MAFWSNGGLNIKRSFQWVGNVVFRADPGLVDGPRIFIPQFTDSVTPFLITSFVSKLSAGTTISMLLIALNTAIS